MELPPGAAAPACPAWQTCPPSGALCLRRLARAAASQAPYAGASLARFTNPQAPAWGLEVGRAKKAVFAGPYSGFAIVFEALAHRAGAAACMPGMAGLTGRKGMAWAVAQPAGGKRLGRWPPPKPAIVFPPAPGLIKMPGTRLPNKMPKAPRQAGRGWHSDCAAGGGQLAIWNRQLAIGRPFNFGALMPRRRKIAFNLFYHWPGAGKMVCGAAPAVAPIRSSSCGGAIQGCLAVRCWRSPICLPPHVLNVLLADIDDKFAKVLAMVRPRRLLPACIAGCAVFQGVDFLCTETRWQCIPGKGRGVRQANKRGRHAKATKKPPHCKTAPKESKRHRWKKPEQWDVLKAKQNGRQ